MRDKDSSLLSASPIRHSNFWYIVTFLLILTYQYFDISNSRNVLWRESNSGLDRSTVHVFLFFLIGFTGLYYISFLRKRPKAAFYWIAWILFSWATVVEICTSGAIWVICQRSGLALLWIFLFSIGYDIAYRGDRTQWKLLNFFMFAFWGMTVYSFLLSYHNHMNMSAIGASGVFNLAYNVLAFLPFLLLNPKKKLNKLGIVVSSLLVFLSLKRGALISFMSMIIGYIYLKKSKKVSRAKKIFYLILVVILLTLAFHYFDSYTDGALTKRFSNEELQGGSGRGEQFVMAWKLWTDTATLLQLFGTGATRFQALLDIAVHNEFLAWLAYYGIIGLMLFLSFLMLLAKKQSRLNKAQSPYASVHVTILLNFLVTSLVSGFYFMHPTMFYMLTLGAIWGAEERRLLTEEPQVEPEPGQKIKR